MKGLNQFVKFDWESFAKDKLFVVTGVREDKDFNTGAHLGTKVDCAIKSDKTNYVTKDGSSITNLYEKITFKIAKDVKIPIETLVLPVNAVATVYTDKNTNERKLSVKCEGFKTPASKG